ncbi:MAG: PAS domain-containing protein [Candidatus Omnitrophica bacterium]|nr:PAS domain-containing protein [Candidatus Omnitrophota bacterium]
MKQTKKEKKLLLPQETHSHLKEKVRKQTDELKIKNAQLQKGVDREKLADDQIHILTKAVESVLDGVFVVDAKTPDFPIIYANSSFYSLTGYTKKEILGKNYFLLCGFDVNERVSEEIKQILFQGKPYHGEIANLKKNGEKFSSLLRMAPIRDIQGEITHYVGIKTDITLMKEKDLEIENQREEILHVTRVGKLAEFVSSLAHEISQPLTSILSYAQAAQRIFAGREPQLQEILQYIVNDDHRAVEVIRRLRTLLKKSKPTFEPLDINTLITDTANLMMAHITARNKIIKLKLDDPLPMIQGDRIQLQQVILNLISNSLEAMEASRESRELMVETSLQGAGMILVEVKDSGCGIPLENMNKLFTHFFTSKPDGLGMGLSISRSIVEAHGGCLEAKNNPDGGATFYFTLPVNMKQDL